MTVMKKYNANNERIKRKYLHHLQYADRKNEKSLDKAASAIERFESYTAYKPFNKFHIEICPRRMTGLPAQSKHTWI